MIKNQSGTGDICCRYSNLTIQAVDFLEKFKKLIKGLLNDFSKLNQDLLLKLSQWKMILSNVLIFHKIFIASKWAYGNL